MAVNADALDLLGLRKTLGPKILGGENGQPTESRVADGRGTPRPNTERSTQGSQFKWQLSGRKEFLENLYATQIEEMALGEYINTEGSLWIDRVGVPTAELQRARLGGVALVRNATFPGHVVSWKFHAPATAEDVAILVPEATSTAFKVIVYNLATSAVQTTMTGWNVDPGTWEITQGIDANGDDMADESIETRTVPFERTHAVELTFAPRATTVLTFKLKSAGTPYWQRPDLGIDPQDIERSGNELRVTIHSLGSVPTPPSEIVLRNPEGRVLAAGKIPAIDAPLDLHPKTVQVVLALPEGTVSAGSTVEIDPAHAVTEITTLNNVVRL
jgi:hypothetical protein